VLLCLSCANSSQSAEPNPSCRMMRWTNRENATSCPSFHSGQAPFGRPSDGLEYWVDDQSGPIQCRCSRGLTTAVAVGRHTLPVTTKRASSCVQRRSAHRIRGTTLVVGTGGAVRPVTLCLSAQGSRWTDPTIAPAFDGLKYSVSRRVTFIDHSLLGSSFLGPRNVRFSRRLSPPGFRSAPRSGGYGPLIAPSTEIFSYDYISSRFTLERRTRCFFARTAT
jgi:hypothetical protein